MKTRVTIKSFLFIVVIIFGIIGSSVTTATPIGIDSGTVCAALGILKGDGSGVTVEYLSKPLQRYQVVVLAMRFFEEGLDVETINYSEWTDNFDDVKDNPALWDGGKNQLAYIHEHPEIGFVGVGNNKFEPLRTITGKELYVLALNLLGYSSGVDYTWDNVITKAESYGVDLGIVYSSLINADLADAMVNLMLCKMKDSNRIFIETLIEKGVVDATAAAQYGFIAFPSDVVMI